LLSWISTRTDYLPCM